MTDGWRCAGVRWGDGVPVLRWLRVGPGPGSRVAERGSVLRVGQRLAFVVVGERRCLGVWRAGRWRPCPPRAVIPGGATRAQCEECAGLDRAHSVAADTFADDPRPYRVYLAWFGPGSVKVGITGEARGATRLLEQGAVAFTWIGAGPLMAARRAEELLRTGLGVPDRIPYERKRGERGAAGDRRVRAAELGALHAAAGALPGWPETLERLPCAVVDHGEAFGLPLRVVGVGTGFGDGTVVVGTLRGVAGPDLHLAPEPESAFEPESAPEPKSAFERAPGPAPSSVGPIASSSEGPIASSSDGPPASVASLAPAVVAVDTRVLAGWVLGPVGAGVGRGGAVVAGGGGGVRAPRGAAGGDGGQQGLF